MRLSVSPGFAVPLGSLSDSNVIDTSFLLEMRWGYEFMFGRFGFTPAVHVDVVPWHDNVDIEDLNFDALFVHAGLEARIAAHFGRFVPFLAIDLGADISHIKATSPEESESDTHQGFGMNVAFGADVLILPTFALGIGFNFHPGITRFVDASGSPKISYFGMLFAASLYL